MKICVATILSIALLLGNSVKLRASVTGPVPSDDGPSSQGCPMCYQGTAAVVGILQGSKGDAGQPGQKGEDGIGRPGKLGPRGPSGLVGATGQAGVKGQTGEIGPIGPMGERGPAGNPGPKGDDGIGRPGEIGQRGQPGLVGTIGRAGVKGQKGEPGETPGESNQRVAFTAVRTSTSDYSTSQQGSIRLPFQQTETLLPPSTSFDLETGTFTSSVPGTYVFMFSLCALGRSRQLWVHLRKNGGVVVACHMNDSRHWEQVSGSAVLVLQQGDTVYLTIQGRAYSHPTLHTTSFSGFLLYPN